MPLSQSYLNKFWQLTILATCCGVTIVIGYMIPDPAHAQDGGGVSGIQEYFIPGTQAQMLETFNQILQQIDDRSCVTDALNNCITTASPDWKDLIESRVSIVAYTDSSVVLIDRAANGYVPAGEYDLAQYDASYSLDKGDVIILDQLGEDQIVGEDRIVSIGGPIFVVRAGWPRFIGRKASGALAQAGQVLAGYWELYPTAIWGTEYGSPLGENGDSAHVDDRATTAVVQARSDGTMIRRNGTFVATLQRGQSLLIEDIAVGDTITGDQPLSVSLITSGLQRVAMRFFNLTPPTLADHEYILPLSSLHFTLDENLLPPLQDILRLYIYAYDATTYTIYQGDSIIATGSLAAGETIVQPILNTGEYTTDQIFGNGLYIVTASGTRLQVLAAVDSDGAQWDWGFPVVGQRYLVDDYYLAWSPATGPNYPTSEYLGPGHPVFLSPVADNTSIQVDWDNDGQADKTVLLDQRQWIALLDESDYDNTGAHLTGSGPFAITWGEDLLASVIDGFDLGYTILPQPPEFFEETLLELDKQVWPELSWPGGYFEVSLTLTAGPFDIEDVAITDKLPTPEFRYHPGSALVNFPDGSQMLLEPSAANQNLTWDIKSPLNSNLDYTLKRGETLSIIFQMDVSVPYSAATFPDTQVNNAVGYGRWQTFEFRPSAFDFVEIIDQPSLTIVKEAVPESSNVFYFSSTISNSTTFTLVDDGDSNHNDQTFTNLTPDTYTVGEDLDRLPDQYWGLLSITCRDLSGQPVSTEVDLIRGQVQVSIQDKQHVTCTFVNERANFFAGDDEPGLYLPLIIK